MLPADDIKRLIEQGLPRSPVIVQGDDGVHSEATMISPAFADYAPSAERRLTGDSA
jgi:acid stress-induced BolA-like protein IbaG/YrbA